jgi:hypothetical protein
MTHLHERAFAYRPVLFWTISALAVWLGSRTPGLSLAMIAAGTAGAGAAAWLVFRYTRWLVRIDGRFQDVNPYKIRVTTLAAFYGSACMAIAVLLVGALLPVNLAQSPLENATVLYLVPALLGSAAGALRGGRDSGVID